MDRITLSNEAVLTALESAPHVDWLSTKKYSDCTQAIVVSGLSKKFERPDDTHARNRKEAAMGKVRVMNRTIWTHKRPPLHQVSIEQLALMLKVKSIMTTWFRGATFSLDDCWVGPGESFEARRGHTSPVAKFSGDVTVTPDALPLFRKFLQRTPGLVDAYRNGEYRIKLVKGNRMSTVPKTVEKDRVICMEPDGNMLLQKALGQCFRRVYQKVTGRDLDRTQDFHKKIVYEALIPNGRSHLLPATIDLSGASDSISMLLCKEILPPWIFSLICSTRSPMFKIGDEWEPWNIVSSMGNGFTFELLTLITLAVCYVSRCQFMTTYGDDIICDSGSAGRVVKNLELLGFTINIDKSCIGIPQLESCGAFSFAGNHILRYELTWMQTDHDVVVTMNKLLRLSEYYANCTLLGPLTRDLWYKLYKLNKGHIPLGPNHDSDIDGRWAMLPQELHPYHKMAIPDWGAHVCDALQWDPADVWLVDLLEFESDHVPSKQCHPFVYIFVRMRLLAVPTWGKRYSGKWVRKKALVNSSIAVTRNSWNRRDKVRGFAHVHVQRPISRVHLP